MKRLIAMVLIGIFVLISYVESEAKDIHYVSTINNMDIQKFTNGGLPYYKASGKTDEQKAINIYYHVINNLEYDYVELDIMELNGMTAVTPLNEAWKHKKGICTIYAYAYAYYCDVNGLVCDVEFCTVDGIGHAYNKVMIDNIWYHVDCTYGDGTPGKLSGFKIIPYPDNVVVTSYDGQALSGTSVQAQAQAHITTWEWIFYVAILWIGWTILKCIFRAIVGAIKKEDV